jgi:chromosome segregation ATPase
MFDYSDNDEKHLIEKAKFFLKIRDISGIQAAQLIQANKEYQSAIETIVNNFVLVLDNIDILRNTCKENQNHKDFLNNNHHRDILDKLDQTELIYSKELDNSKVLSSEVSNADKQIENAEKYFEGLQKLIKNFFSEINAHLKSIQKEASDDQTVQKTIEQINNVLAELKNNIEVLTGIIQKLSPFKNSISEIFKNKNVIQAIDFNEIKEYVALLKKNRDKIDGKIDENKLIGSSSLKQIKKSISEIKYYDFFENVIEEITQELNTISFKLKEGAEIDEETLSDNLNMLKEYYTIETEHSIHEKIAKGEEIDIENKDDGEIEFF